MTAHNGGQMINTNAVRVRPKDAHYRIEDPQSGLCIRLHSIPADAPDAPKVVGRLTAGDTATWFASWRQAAEAFARYLPGQPLQIVRVDA